MIEKFTKYIENKEKDYIIFDIGSRDCKQSIEFYNEFPNAKIYAFECNPNTLPLCEKNIESYSDRITLIKGAVCDTDGEITFYPIDQEKTITSWKDGNPGASSLFKTNGTYTTEHYVQTEITVSCHRLDTIMSQHHIPNVDLIWMDLQGAELLALKGLGKYLEKVQYIQSEVSHKEIYTNQVMFRDFHNFMISNKFSILNQLSFKGWQEDAVYKNTRNSFDIVIPVGPNDIDVIQQQLDYTKKNIIGYRNIYLITKNTQLQIDGCIIIPEHIFPFSINTVENIHGKNNRNGWYYQQLLKFYSGNIIPGILDRYLVIDADTFFLKPTTFVHNNKCLYNIGREYHRPYFEHMKKLHPEFKRLNPKISGICHHMIFETKYVNELIRIIENNHKDIFYNVFLNSVTEYTGSGASEYEIYFNFIFKYHPDKVHIRPLKWGNRKTLDDRGGLDYVSCHWYLR
jgi:FkbM family methyltransferase